MNENKIDVARFFKILLTFFLIGFLIPIAILASNDVAINPIITGVWNAVLILCSFVAFYRSNKTVTPDR